MSKTRQKHPLRETALKLYLYADMNQKEIADELSLTEKTVGTWCEQDMWRELKQAKTLSPDSLIKYYYEQSELIIQVAKDNNRPISSREADTLVKLSAGIKNLDKRVDASVTMTVLKRFTEYLKTYNPALAVELTNHYVGYIKSME